MLKNGKKEQNWIPVSVNFKMEKFQTVARYKTC